MAFVAASQTLDGTKSHSLGPVKIEYGTFTVGTGITTGTITAANLHTVNKAIVAGVVLTAATTYSGAVATLTFTDPAASIVGDYILIGK